MIGIAGMTTGSIECLSESQIKNQKLVNSYQLIRRLSPAGGGAGGGNMSVSASVRDE